jgi:type IV pilus assembly protein PilV
MKHVISRIVVNNKTSRLQHGYTLIEVLIAAVVLAVGLLGIAGLQMLSLKNTHSAFLRSQATLLAYDIIDSMRANPSVLSSYSVALNSAPSGTYASCVGTSANCTAAEIATYDLFEWKCKLGKWSGGSSCTGGLASIEGLLPDGDASIAVSGNDVTVTVQWIDKDRREQASTAAERIVDLEITTRIQ